MVTTRWDPLSRYRYRNSVTDTGGDDYRVVECATLDYGWSYSSTYIFIMSVTK